MNTDLDPPIALLTEFDMAQLAPAMDEAAHLRGLFDEIDINTLEQLRIDKLAYDLLDEMPSAVTTAAADRHGVASFVGRLGRVLRGVLLWCAGTNHRALRIAPSEESNLLGLGGAVIATAAAAAISASVALSLALHSTVASIAIGLMWSFAVLSLDRWILATSSGGTLTARILKFVPRLLLSTFLALLISEPLLLALFSDEVSAQVRQDQAVAAHASAREESASFDPSLQSLMQARKAANSRISAADVKVSRALEIWSNEVKGTDAPNGKTTGVPGTGQIAQAAHERYLSALNTYKSVLSSETPRISQLNDEISQTQSMQITATERAIANAPHANGLLTRLHALASLSVGGTIWVIRGLILLIDTMPLLMRLFQTLVGRRSYDRAVDALECQEQIASRRIFAEARMQLEILEIDAAQTVRAARELASRPSPWGRPKRRASRADALFWPDETEDATSKTTV